MKNITFLQKFSAYALALLLVVSPLSALAKHGDLSAKANLNASADVKTEKKTEKKNEEKKSCLRAFGHLIAPGWIKVKGDGSLKIGDNCRLPFGIASKLNHNNDNEGDDNDGDEEDQADVTAPVISGVISGTNSTSAAIVFSTDERASAKVFYSTSAGLDVNSSSTLRVSQDSFTRLHKLVLSGLTANTKYYFVVQASDKEGNTALSTEFSFTTKLVTDTTAPKISALVAVATNSSAQVSWTTDEPATSKVFYGTNTPIDTSASSTARVESNDMVTAHSLTVPNLSANTQYFLQVQSKDAAGNVSSSTEFGLKTGI